MPKRDALRLGAVIAAAALAGFARADIGPCDKLLEHGIRSYVSEAARNDFRRSDYGTVCAAFEKASRDKTHATAKALYEQVGGEGDFDPRKFGRLTSAYCTLGKTFAANLPLYRKTAGSLWPESVEAWRRCSEAAKGKHGPAMEVEQIDDYTLSFTLHPTARDLLSVKVTMEGFDKCSGFVQDARPQGAPAQFDVPVLVKDRVHDLACFRRIARKPPCGTEATAPATFRIDFEDGEGKRFTHRFRMARVMSWECPLPAGAAPAPAPHGAAPPPP
jgi:hypothetical protein